MKNKLFISCLLCVACVSSCGSMSYRDDTSNEFSQPALGVKIDTLYNEPGGIVNFCDTHIAIVRHPYQYANIEGYSKTYALGISDKLIITTGIPDGTVCKITNIIASPVYRITWIECVSVNGEYIGYIDAHYLEFIWNSDSSRINEGGFSYEREA